MGRGEKKIISSRKLQQSTRVKDNVFNFFMLLAQHKSGSGFRSALSLKQTHEIRKRGPGFFRKRTQKCRTNLNFHAARQIKCEFKNLEPGQDSEGVAGAAPSSRPLPYSSGRKVYLIKEKRAKSVPAENSRTSPPRKGSRR